MLKPLLQSMLASPFVRNVTVLTAGNLLAQLIPFLVLPLYTRMFSAEIFAMQALLQVGMLFLAPLATGYYEWAVPSPPEPREARALANVAMFLAGGLCIFTLLLIAFFQQEIVTTFNLAALGDWIYVYPLIIFATAMSSVANYWLLRSGSFSKQALNRIVLTSSAAIISILLGAMGFKTGLLVGFVGGALVGAIWGMAQAGRDGLRIDCQFPPRYFGTTLVEYREFPQFGSIPSAINNLAAQVPLLIITATFSLGMAGHYAVARGLLSSGCGLIAVAMGQVVLKQFTDLIHNHQPLWPHFRRVSIYVFALGVAVSGGLYVLGPWFFSHYLGADWADSADIIRLLSLNVMFWLLGPAVAMASVAIKNLRIIALWQLIYGLMAVALLLFRHEAFPVFIHRVVAFEAIAYGLYFLLMALAIWRYDHRQKPA